MKTTSFCARERERERVTIITTNHKLKTHSRKQGEFIEGKREQKERETNTKICFLIF